MCYEISGIVKLNQNIQELVKQKHFYKLHAKKEMKAKGYSKLQVVSHPLLITDPEYRIGFLRSKKLNLTELNMEIKKVQNQIQDYTKNLIPGTERELFIGVAIVVVQSQRDQVHILLQEEESLFQKIISLCGSKSKYRFERAAEPSDVYWENLNVTSFQRSQKMFLTYLATVVMVGACFGIIYGINLGKSNLNQTNAPKSVIIFLSFLCSFVIIGVNKSLNYIVRTLSI